MEIQEIRGKSAGNPSWKIHASMHEMHACMPKLIPGINLCKNPANRPQLTGLALHVDKTPSRAESRPGGNLPGYCKPLIDFSHRIPRHT